MVLIPAYNEGEYLGETLDALLQELSPYQILVIDDGSTDHTGEVAREEGVLLHTLKRNKGKGKALEEGVKRCIGEIILFLDADLGLWAPNTFPLVRPIQENEVDATIGILPPPKQKGGLGLTRFVAREGISFLTGYGVQGALSGQRAFRRRVLLKLLPFAPGFGLEVGLTLDLIKYQIPFKTVEVELYHRETLNDWQGFYHRGRQLYDIIKAFMMKG